MAWQPPKEDFDNVEKSGWSPPKEDFDNNKTWSPPKEDFDDSPTKIEDVDKLKELQSTGQKLTDKQQKILFKADDERSFLDKVSGAAGAFIPAAAEIIGDTATGAVELANKAVVQPAAFALSGGYNRLDSEEAKKIFKEREEAIRSLGVGVAKDIEETANAAVRFGMFGSATTDKLLGKSEEERFRAWQDRQTMRQLEAQEAEQNPDRVAALLSQNSLIQGYVEYEAKKRGLSPEEGEKGKQDYIPTMLDQGLTKDQINEKVATLGEFVSPVAIPGGGRLSGAVLKPLSKVTAPVFNKATDLTARGISKFAGGTEFAANKVLQGTELLQTGARKIGEYAINDPDTWIKGTVNTAIMPVVGVAKPVSATARVIKDITKQVDVGGTAGRMGMVERAGQAVDSSDLTKKLFGAQGKGGVARAKLADWAIRQSNALVQPGINAAALNVAMGLPDIETAEDLGFVSGTGFGIGSLAGSRAIDRVSGLVDPKTTMAEKITNFVTPDPAAYRRDEDADIKRFMAQATPDIKQNITDLADIEKRKVAVDATIASLEKERDAQIDPEDAAFKQTQIDGFLKQKEALSKATPETQAEALRQTQLAFIDAYDLAQSTGGVAGLRGVNIAVLDSENADQFFRDLYGDSLKQAETTINLLTGVPSLTETDSQKLTEARQLLQKFQNDVEGAKTTRGFAIQEDNTDPNSSNFVPPHLRRINQVGATAVINADLIKHLSSQGFNIRHTLQHEVQHAVQQFAEVNKMLAPLRGQLFDQKIKNDDGTIEVYQQGIYSDEDLNRYAARYAKLMSPSDGGASFYAQFGGDSEKMRAYIKDEILAETAAATGEYAGGTRASLDDVGRNVMDWLEVKTKSGRLKQLKEALRRNGIIFDNIGAVSSVLNAQMSPETLAMVRQYQRGLKDFDGTMTVQQSRESDEPDIPLTKVLGSVALQNKYRHADFFEKEQIIKATAPDGSVTEIVVPKEAKIDPFIDVYRTQNGQLVDANGNVVTLGPEITFGSMPDNTTFEVDTRIARKSNGSPIILTNREMKSRALERTKMIQNAIDSAKDDGSGVRLSDTGNGNYRGVMSPAQIEAFMSLPNNVVSPNLKRMTKFFNELMARNDGTRVVMEYQAALLNGKYKALSPKIRDEVPIGFQLTQDGNFALTTISISRLYDKMQAWADKKPSNLQPWNGDTGAFWDSVTKYLDNHAKGEKGETGLNPDAYIAGKMKNKINDLFNAYNAETKQSNPERSTLPRARGKDNLDIVIRSRRLDRINNFSESPSQKLPINYGYLTTNYMPAVNPMAAPMTAEEVQNRFDGSVTATRVRRAMATGEIDALESELRQMDDLLPTESLQLVQGEDQMPRIQIVSMFDPENVASLEPEEIVSDIDAETEAELAILDAQDGTVPPQDIAKVLSSKLDQLYADGGRSPIIPALESELEKIYQQLESQAQEQAAATEDVVEAPETIEGDVSSPTDLIAQAVEAYNTGRVDNETQTLPEYIRSVVDEAGILQIPPDVTDEQIAAAADDVVQYRQSLKDRIQSGTQFSNAVVAPAGLQYLPAFHASKANIEDKFDINFVNTGNKQQVYGWGLYFAENKKEIDTFYPLPYKYKVDLDIDENKILNWNDVPDERLIDQVEELSYNIEIDTGFRPRINSVADYYEALSEYLGDAKAASMKLKEMGFDGIKYTDRITTSAQKTAANVDELLKLSTTYNYVIFDDSKIKVLEKNDQPVGSITQFMPAVQAIPERFTGTGEKGEERRGRYVAPPEFWTKFDIDEFERGGKFFDLETGEDITDKTYATGTIDVTGKRPSLVSDSIIDEMPEEKGRTWKTNLFRKSAVWEWISENPPEVAAIGSKEKPDPVLISVEGGRDHFYTLKTEFPNGVQLARYPNEGSEPRLRPTKKGQIQLGNVIGRIKTKKLEHPVYDTITIGAKFMPAVSDSEYLDLAQNPEKNREQLQRMVDQAARNAGYNVEPMYHGTDANFNVFNINFAGSREWGAGVLGDGFYFTPNYDIAKEAADIQGKNGRVLKTYLKYKNPATNEVLSTKEIQKIISDPDAIKNLPEFLKQKGYDAIVEDFDGMQQVVVSDPSQIKSADPVTYDDEGNVIPLSQRFQTTSPDIRFMPAEGDYPSVGININSKTQDFTDQILRGEKTIETRPSNSLKSLIGKRVGIVRTGKGKATLVGYANIEEPIVYNNVEEFRADQDKHLVEAGSDFDIKPDQKKYGYPLTDVESIEPIEVPSNLPNWYSARSIPQTQFMPAENTASLSDLPAPEAQQEVEKPLGMVALPQVKNISPEQSKFISEKPLRKFDSLGDKNATQVNADNMKYPVNPIPDSVALPGRWGLVNAKITGMPKTFKEVSEIIDRQVNRLIRLVNANPEFAKESARFYRDMAESATMITDAAFPSVKGKEKFLFDELVLRFLALGSPRTSVAANASKSAGSAAALIDEFEAGYKIGFGEQSHGAKTTYNAWKQGGHFDLSLPGVQDKVRSFYLNSLAELIEMAEAQNDVASVEELMIRAGKSMRILDPNHSAKLTDVEKKEIQRLLDGKATIDMWDMAAKGWAWPGYIIFKNRRNSVKQPFQWSQDDFEKIGTLKDKNWKQILSELKITSPDQLRYQQARALKIDGNQDWTLETWNERKSQPFPDSTKFSYYTQGTESGLSPGGGGPLYDAQQSIDGLLADRLNELGLATLFGKAKLKARNSQEILWALEKLDNPIEANNDLSLFGSTFEPFLNEVLKLRTGKDVDPKSRAENVLAAMERAYAAMAQQLIPIEVVSGGTSEEAKRIQDAIKNLQDAGDPDAATTLTLHVADGLGNAINDLAIKHGIKATIENVDVGEGGYTENQQVNVAPNIRVTLRGKPEETFLVLETLSRAMDQDGGNVIRKPTMRELNDSRVNKNIILTIPTTGLDQAQRNKMFLDLSALKDANGDSFLTGFTEVNGGIAIGNQFYSGNYEKAILDNQANIDGILKNYNQSPSKTRFETTIIQTFSRGQASTKIEPEKIMVKKKEVLRPSFASDLYEYIKNRMTNIPLAGSRPSFAQKTDFEKNWIDKADTLFSRLKSYPIGNKSEIEKAKLEALDIASNTKRTAALVALKSELETALLRDQISEDVAIKLKSKYGFKEEKQSKEEE